MSFLVFTFDLSPLFPGYTFDYFIGKDTKAQSHMTTYKVKGHFSDLFRARGLACW